MKKLHKSNLYWKIVFAYIFVFIYLLCVIGCNPTLSSDEEVLRFERAGPITVEVDVDRLLKAKIHTGYYQVVPGDVLELQMAAILRVISSDLSSWFRPVVGYHEVEPYLFRVSDAGTITLPIVGKIPVAGKKLTEIETSVVNAYYPKYVANLPSVVCKVKEYQLENITVVGGVAAPGLYRLRSDEMSLVTLLMKAGGIVEDGAALITIQRAGCSGERELLETKGSSDLTTLPRPADVKKKEVDLVFQQNDFQDTEGRLTVNRRKKTLHSAEKVDIASEKDRAAFAKNSAKLRQDTQSSDIRQALTQLAKSIEQSSNIEPYVGDSTDSEPKKLVNIAEYELNAPATGPTEAGVIDRTNSKPIVLPVKGLNIPFADVVLYDGDVVEVEKLNPEVFTVIGHVNKAGAFPYPPDAKYNLMQALSFAGGIDLVADPQYVSVYRQAADGGVVSATFGIDAQSLAKAYSVAIKPGDVISVDITPRTRINLLLSQLLRFNVGVYVRPLEED